ncbi:MAG: glutamate--tRNA ligase [Ignavibacteriales bacterium]|jgi:glutamyl-tRNA synthetase|nr:glutamate--tRNA ligase [Ignavibacteriaceae bacterium]NLH60202.1 glutamate--tRNA ligase [Ignavibacteriales bacterium]HOJ17320.1 glutamate--tRNA ligase [Ignavibacteriaceae bacterium]HPO54862.1 glutamate--tRNA ligase [Ignavibacteriaceae bacterium]
MISDIVRVRFAPSPTGYLHVGGLRTALYNYLFARHTSGKFILRIEDTDRARFVPGAVENLIDTLRWSGLTYDEGPDKDGGFGPYIQSERLEIYKEYTTRLINSGKAYYCFCTPERLKELRESQTEQKLQGKYDKHCLSLSADEIQNKLNNNIPHVVRLNVPANEIVTVHDIIRGTVEFDSNTVDDQVLLKSDGYPTYHLANVVDDHLMKITHVIRGEEWLPSTPKHVLLYNAFGWEIPEFAHLPLLLNPDKSKLSKRQGDVAVEDYRSKGFLKEALVNFVALLGWNAGDDREFYYLDELISGFSLERVNKSGAVFNIEKLNWLNFEHLRQKPVHEVISMLRTELKSSDFSSYEFPDNYLAQVIESMRERVSFVKELLTKSPYFFQLPAGYDEATLKKRWKEDSHLLLSKLRDNFVRLSDPTKEDFENSLHNTALENNVGNGKLIHPLRLAVSGMGEGPGVFDIVAILGKEETIKRIDKALSVLT